ncbi:hypothetical protein [Streptomyces sp. M1013]|uniref:hypothetical protein n=1 Tax=Streptomyces sp. M1013 TaxID=549798 RepID=UPI0015C552D0|nr:hypothetical protein [Streptomyces sp. M1013]
MPRTACHAGAAAVCGSCQADDVARRQVVVPPQPEDDGQEPGKLRRGLFRRRT